MICWIVAENDEDPQDASILFPPPPKAATDADGNKIERIEDEVFRKLRHSDDIDRQIVENLDNQLIRE